MKIVFMGTPEFAAASLKALVESGQYEIAAVVTQPDRPKGRGHKVMMSAVKEYALTQSLPVLQPERVKTPEFQAEMEKIQPELIVVAAFGQFLPKTLLELPKFGCINVHASLLPRYRGAAPIHYAILKGEKEAGVTIMQMDVGMDTGAMLSKVSVPVGPEMTQGELHDILKEKAPGCSWTPFPGLPQGPFSRYRSRKKKPPMPLSLPGTWRNWTGTKRRKNSITRSELSILGRVPSPCCPMANG